MFGVFPNMMNRHLIVMRRPQLKMPNKFSFLQNEKLLCVFTIFMLMATTIFGAHSLLKLNTSYSIKQFLPTANPLLRQEARVRKQFDLIEAPAFLIALTLPKNENEDWLSDKNLRGLEALTSQLEKLSEAKKVISISNVQAAGEDPNSLSVGPLVKMTSSQDRHRRILGDSLLTPNLISKDARTTLVMIDIGFIPLDKTAGIEKAVREKCHKIFPEAGIEVGGVPAIQSDVGILLMKELKNFVSLAFIASVIVLALIFSNWSGIFVVLLIMVMANIITLGGMAFFGISFSVLSTTIPILVSITVLAISSHTLLRIDEELKKGSSPSASKFTVVISVLRILFMPNLLAALTTCVGFLTLVSVSVPLIKQYGISTALCVMAAWLVTNLALLGFLPLVPVSKARAWTSKQARWSLFLINHRRAVIFSVLGLCIFCVWSGHILNWSPKLFDDLPENHPTREATYNIDKELGGTLGLDIVIDAKHPNGWNDPMSVLKLDQLTKEIRGKTGIGNAVSLGDYIRSAHFKSGLSHLSRKGIAETVFLYSLAAENPLRNYLIGDGRSTRISIRTHDVPAQKLESLIQSLKHETEALFPKYHVSVSGMAMSAPILNEDLSRNLIFGFWQALVIIGVVLAFVFRSLKWSLVACVPNLVPPVALLGAMGLTNIPVKPGLAIVFSIALGLSFNNTVYLLERIKSQKRRGFSAHQITRAFYFESNPCIVSTLVIIAGFTVFLGSYFSLNRYFGVFMLISIFGGLLGDLALLPSLLVSFPRLLGKDRPLLAVVPNDRASAIKIAASIAVVILTAQNAHADLNGTDILKKAEKQITSKFETANVKLRIIESDGSKKDRDLTIKRKSGSKNYVLARLDDPADLRGTAFLSVISTGKEDQWLYLPSSKQTRRIVGGNRQSGFLGSEITYEDLSASTAEGAQIKGVKEQMINGEKFAVIETRAKKENSSYSLVRSWISLNNYLALKADYYDWTNHLVKQIEFKNYKSYAGVWRAQVVTVKNLKNKRESQLFLSNLNTKHEIPDSDFSVQALETD